MLMTWFHTSNLLENRYDMDGRRKGLILPMRDYRKQKINGYWFDYIIEIMKISSSSVQKN